MKNFWIAIVLLTLVVTLTAFNAFFVQREIDTLRTRALSEDAEGAKECFAKIEPYLALTVNHVVLEQAQNAVLEMAVYRGQSDADYLAARERFLAALDEIEDGEKFNLSNIF